jgi:hypothetical protein
MKFNEEVLKEAVDLVILKHSDDPMIKDAIKQLDELARKTGMSMYDLLAVVVKKHMAIEDAKDEWDQLLHDRGL